ncbi:MAG: Amuc_1099 family pilus-like system protein [bacterium]
MDWAKKNYDTVILGVFTAVFVFNAAFLYFESSGFISSLPTASENTTNKSKATPAETTAIEEAKVITEKPFLWNEKSPSNEESASNKERGNLFVSRLFILKGDKLIDPIEGQEQLHPPIANAWLIKFGLNYADANVKDQDADGDGFTNLEEYNAKSDPKNKVSTPPKFTKLRFLKFEQKPFMLVFKGNPDGEGKEFQINANNARTQFKKLNEKIDGAPYKIISYAPKKGEKNGVPLDLSELTVENTETQVTIVLVVKKETNDPTSFGEFFNVLTNEKFRLQKGEEFTIKPDVNTKLKLIDISSTEAKIQDVATGTTSTLSKSSSPAP